MEILFSDVDEDDLVECAELYVSVFKNPPWNEDWGIEDAFGRLGDFLACPGTIAVKAESEGNLCGFFTSCTLFGACFFGKTLTIQEATQWKQISFF